MNHQPPRTRPDPAEHPEELLAGLVDGSASAEERRDVESHLAECARCRTEVQAATRARAALASLRQLEAPGLADRGLQGLAERAAAVGMDLPEAPAAAVVTDLRDRRERRVRVPLWQRAAWGAGLAAAGTLAALFVFAREGPSEFPTAGQAPREAATAAAPAPPEVVRSDATYDQADLRALGDVLARTPAPEFGAEGEPAASPTAAQEAPPEDAATLGAPAETVLACLQAAGIDPAARAVYLEEAEFEERPAYIGAFLVPSPQDPPALLLVVVQRDNCSELTRIERSL